MLYWNFYFSFMIWSLQLEDLLVGIGDWDLLEEDKLDELVEVWWRPRFILIWYSCFELLLRGDLVLLEDNELLFVLIHIFTLFSDLEGPCKETYIPAFVQGCSWKTSSQGTESFFLLLLLSAIAWSKQQGLSFNMFNPRFNFYQVVIVTIS